MRHKKSKKTHTLTNALPDQPLPTRHVVAVAVACPRTVADQCRSPVDRSRSGRGFAVAAAQHEIMERHAHLVVDVSWGKCSVAYCLWGYAVARTSVCVHLSEPKIE